MNWLNTSLQNSRNITLAPVAVHATFAERFQRIALTWMSDGIQLVREDRSVCRFSADP
jgi:hypothetical protein